MYHPADATAAEIAAGFGDQDDFEYIELTNISTGPDAVSLELSGIHFPGGVDFAFTGSPINGLAPGGHVLVVRSAAAMTLRYGPGLPIAGEFANDSGLSNSGETIEIDDAEGNTIQQFTFDDNGPLWHPTTDGDGFSLVIVSATAGLSAWSNGDGWRPSLAVGGSPGRADSSPAQAGDANGDSRVDLADLALVQAHLGVLVGATPGMGDFNADGAVTRADVATLAQNFGISTSANASPSAAASLIASAREYVRAQRRVPRDSRQLALGLAYPALVDRVLMESPLVSYSCRGVRRIRGVIQVT
jgi:hypothetical protein